MIKSLCSGIIETNGFIHILCDCFLPEIMLLCSNLFPNALANQLCKRHIPDQLHKLSAIVSFRVPGRFALPDQENAP